jgi:hypothetical protein
MFIGNDEGTLYGIQGFRNDIKSSPDFYVDFDISYSGEKIKVGQTVKFRIVKGYTEDGKYEWDFQANGSYIEGKRIMKYKFWTPGEKEIILRGTSPDGVSDTVGHSFNVSIPTVELAILGVGLPILYSVANFFRDKNNN